MQLLLRDAFLKDAESNGQCFRAQVVRVILDQEVELQRNPEHIKFLCEVDGDTALKDWESNTEQLYRFRCITTHQGPLCTLDEDYKGSTHNLLVEWESGVQHVSPLT
jgi:hypothetical protein